MRIPNIYRKVNPEWIRDFRLAHSSNVPVGYFSADYVSPSLYIDVNHA